MSVSVHVSIDVPDLVAGLSFYDAAFGFAEVARPFAAMAVLDAGGTTICLHEKPDGSAPTPDSNDRRHYTRHWTPVHLDLHVPDLDRVLARIRAAGGLVEREFRDVGPKDVAFCSDPFGHGFCVIEDAVADRPNHDKRAEKR